MKRLKIRLFTKFVLAFISVGLVPVIFVSIYSGSRFRVETYDMMVTNYRQAAQYGARNVDALIEKYNTITKMLYNYEPMHFPVPRLYDGQGLARIIRGGEQDENSISRLIKNNEMQAFLRLITTSDLYISSAGFADTERNLYTSDKSGRTLVNTQKLLNIYDLDKTAFRKNGLFVLPVHYDDYFYGNMNSVITIGRNLIDLSMPVGSEEILGTLFVNINVSAIDMIFRGMDVYQKGRIVVEDAEGRLIYTNAASGFNGESKDTLELSGYCEATDWRVIISATYENAMDNIVELQRVIYSVAIVVLTGLAGISLYYSRVFTKPVRGMLAMMKRIQAGDFNVSLTPDTRDEMKELSEGFNEMARRLSEYVETVFIARIRRREAELAALKSQIQPHFLYNSLEVIRMNAVLNDDGGTAELALILAEQMRYIIGRVGETVRLGEELRMLRNYLAFIDISYDNHVKWDIDAPDHLLDTEVLGLMIQPIVENAIVHGLKPLGGGRISVIIKELNGDISICVSDDGVGMSKEKTEELTARLSNEQEVKGTDSIGLLNVHDRLRYTFGEQYGITITGAEGKGTVVTILLPAKGNADV